MKLRLADHVTKHTSEDAVLSCGLASLVFFCGVFGLLGESWVKQMLGSRIDLHAMFGVFLCTLVAVRFHARLKRTPRMPPADIRSLSRELSRMVYLSLYAVIGIRQILAFASRLSPAGTREIGNFAADDDLQALVAYGLVGLMLIRALAFGFLGARDRNIEELPR
jgi:cytochrome b561